MSRAVRWGCGINRIISLIHSLMPIPDLIMKLLVFAAFTVVADVSHLVGEQRYQHPISSYGVPFGSVGQLNNFVTSTPSPLFNAQSVSTTPTSLLGGLSFSTTAAPIFSGGIVSTTPSTTFEQLPIYQHTSFNGPGGISSIQHSFNDFGGVQLGGPAFHGFENAGIVPSGRLNLHTSQINTATGDFEATHGSTSEVGYDSDSEPVKEIQRHLYFFEAPEEPPLPQARVILPTQPPKKNVKVIFVKAPTFQTAPPPVIPVQHQDEEKTLVYVLVKKPEDPKPIVIPTPPATKPPKPEVFFIKYKNQQEAEEAVSKLQSGIKFGSVSANPVSGGNQFLSSIAQGFGGIDASSLGGLNNAGLFSTTISPLFGTSTFGSGIGSGGLFQTTPTPVIDTRLTGGLHGGLNFDSLNSGNILSTPASPIFDSGFGSTTTSPLLGGFHSGIASTTPASLLGGFQSGIVSTTPTSSLDLGNSFGDISGNFISSTESPLFNPSNSLNGLSGAFGGFSGNAGGIVSSTPSPIYESGAISSSSELGGGLNSVSYDTSRTSASENETPEHPSETGGSLEESFGGTKESPSQKSFAISASANEISSVQTKYGPPKHPAVSIVNRRRSVSPSRYAERPKTK